MKARLVLTVLLVTSCLKLFGQEVDLDMYLQTAKAHSPLLREYRNEVHAAAIDSQLILAGYKPQVGVTSVNSYAPSGNTFGYDAAVTNGGQFSTLIGVSQAFASKRNLAAQFRSAGLAADSFRVAAAIAGQDLARTITSQYLVTYGDQQQLTALTEINRLMGNEGTILRSLTQNNIYRQTDYLTFLVTQNQQALQLKQMRIQYLTDFANLNYLCGITDTAALSKTLTLPQLEAQSFPDVPGSVFFRKYTIDSLRLDNNIRLINLAYRPKLGVFADAGYSTATLGSLYHYFGASAGFSISLPIYDGGKRKLAIRQVNLQEDTRLGYEAFFAQQYAQQLAGLTQQLAATDALLRDINEQIAYSKGLIDANEKLLQTGDARIPDFVIAINNYLNAKALLTQKPHQPPAANQPDQLLEPLTKSRKKMKDKRQKRQRRKPCITCWHCLCAVFIIASCSGKKNTAAADASAETPAAKTRTPVTITAVSNGPLTEYVELNATSQFMQKSYVKANVNGYIQSVNAALGKYVSTGQTLFTLKTKEAQSIGNAVNKLDPSFRFSGLSAIRASAQGYVTVLSHQAGDYVQDGEQLAVINDAASFAFILNLPYELRPYLLKQKSVRLYLPDSTTLTGTIASIIPSVDPASQTQQVVIKIAGTAAIPENLIARVRIIKTQSGGSSQSLPKAALLSDEAQRAWWVMKVINDSTAVKIPVQRGIETADAIEITSPQFTPADRIVLTGNYGLADTAGITIEAKPALP